MKKLLLGAAATLLAVCAGNAQSVVFVHNGEVIENGAHITIYDFNEEAGDMQWAPVLRNTTQEDITIVIQTNINEITDDGSMLSLCVGTQCYAPTATETQEITIPAGGEDHSFHTQFIPMGENSIANAYYVVMNVNDETGTDYQEATITYDYPAYLASESLTTTRRQFNLTQNGSNLVCRYNFGKTAQRQVVISNIVGSRVAAFALDGTEGEEVIDCRLAKGIYIYTLIENGRNVKSYKIIIR